MSIVIAGKGDSTDEIFFQRNDCYTWMVEIFHSMLHQQRNAVIFAYQVKNIVHVGAGINYARFKTSLSADFCDFIIM